MLRKNEEPVRPKLIKVPDLSRKLNSALLKEYRINNFYEQEPSKSVLGTILDGDKSH